MNLPFLFLKTLQNMSNRLKGSMDHSHQSIFHHRLIKLIICSLVEESITWDHFLFWSSFYNKQEDQARKILMSKQFSFVKRFKKELVDELVQDNVRENCSSQRVEYAGEAFDGNLEQVLKNDEVEHRVVSNGEDNLGLIEKK